MKTIIIIQAIFFIVWVIISLIMMKKMSIRIDELEDFNIRNFLEEKDPEVGIGLKAGTVVQTEKDK